MQERRVTGPPASSMRANTLLGKPATGESGWMDVAFLHGQNERLSECAGGDENPSSTNSRSSEAVGEHDPVQENSFNGFAL
jgi:hypothetical protein